MVWAQYFRLHTREPGHNTAVSGHTVGLQRASVRLWVVWLGRRPAGRNLLHTGCDRCSRGRLWPRGGRISPFSAVFGPAPTSPRASPCGGVEWCGRNISGRTERTPPQHGRLRTDGARPARFRPLGATAPGARRPGVILSILGEKVVAVAAHASMEVILCCFPALVGPPQLSPSTSI